MPSPLAIPFTPMIMLQHVVGCLANSNADKISLQFTGLPPNPNEKSKKHWSANAIATKQWRYDAKIIGLQAKAKVISGLALIHYHVSLGDQRRHDYDNVLASFKPVQDGLVDAGMLIDDTIDYVLPIVTFDRLKPRSFTIDIYSLDI